MSGPLALPRRGPSNTERKPSEGQEILPACCHIAKQIPDNHQTMVKRIERNLKKLSRYRSLPPRGGLVANHSSCPQGGSLQTERITQRRACTGQANPSNYQANTKQVLSKCQETTSQIPSNYQAITKKTPSNYLANTKQIARMCQATAWRIPSKCQATT